MSYEYSYPHPAYVNMLNQNKEVIECAYVGGIDYSFRGGQLEINMRCHPCGYIEQKDSVKESSNMPKPRKVIYNNPATIVLWDDGTKTVVKCHRVDVYDKQTGLAMCYMKKALGNSSRAFNDALREGTYGPIAERVRVCWADVERKIHENNSRD